jgi:hypothetical protein
MASRRLPCCTGTTLYPSAFKILQVLTSDEVGSGLRLLKPCPLLAKERFKSLQKRGLMEAHRPPPPPSQRAGKKVRTAQAERRSGVWLVAEGRAGQGRAAQHGAGCCTVGRAAALDLLATTAVTF